MKKKKKMYSMKVINKCIPNKFFENYSITYSEYKTKSFLKTSPVKTL